MALKITGSIPFGKTGLNTTVVLLDPYREGEPVMGVTRTRGPRGHLVVEWSTTFGTAYEAVEGWRIQAASTVDGWKHVLHNKTLLALKRAWQEKRKEEEKKK